MVEDSSIQLVGETKNLVADETSDLLLPWLNRWNDRRIGFHLEDANPILVKYVDCLRPLTNATICADSSTNNHPEDVTGTCFNKDASSETRIFLPLCGKTVDMAYLIPLFREVVGVEGIRQALVEFAQEQPHLKIKEAAHNNNAEGMNERFELFKGEKITLLKGDYFNMKESDTQGRFEAIFDRASMVAIDPSLQKSYVEVLGGLIAPGGKILLVTLERRGEEEAMKKGPPFSIPETSVRELFESQSWVESLTRLQEEDQLQIRPDDRERFEGLDQLLEVVYLIQGKS